MDWLTFISSVVKSSAWPATVITLLVMVRKSLPELVRSLRKFKVKGIELEFGERVKELAEDVGRLVPARARISTSTATLGPGSVGIEEPRPTFIEWASPKLASGRGQIVEAWLLVEEMGQKLLAKRTGTEINSLPSGVRLQRALLQEGLIDQGMAAVFDELRRLRNDAVHLSSKTITAQTISNYVDSALGLSSLFEALAARVVRR